MDGAFDVMFGRILMADRVLSKVVGVASKENILEICDGSDVVFADSFPRYFLQDIG